jgi:hemoglobin
MSGMFARIVLGLGVGLCIASAAARAADGGSVSVGQVDARIRLAASRAVSAGVPIYNRGELESCYRLYQGALTALAPMLEHRPALQASVQKALAKAEAEKVTAQRAYVLRPALDEILKAIPKAEEKSLYERLGGPKAIEAVVDDLVGRAAKNPKVNFTRKGTDAEWEPSKENLATLRKHLIQFVSMATGGPKKYEGRDMKSAHKGMQITDAEFDALAGDLKATLDKLKVPEKEQKELLTLVGSTRGMIVEKR